MVLLNSLDIIINRLFKYKNIFLRNSRHFDSYYDMSIIAIDVADYFISPMETTSLPVIFFVK